MEKRESEPQLHGPSPLGEPPGPAPAIGHADAPAPGAVAAAPSIEQLLQRALQQGMELALAQHRAGQLPAAEEIYRAILATWPDHPDANHNLAVIALEGGHASASLPLFRRACAADPANWQYWLSCFDALLHAGEHRAATEMLELKRRTGLTLAVMSELVERLVDSRFRIESGGVAPGQRAGQPAPGPKVARGKSRAPERPAAAEVAAVEALFRQDRMEDVVLRARAMTLRYPRMAFGWKVWAPRWSTWAASSRPWSRCRRRLCIRRATPAH